MTPINTPHPKTLKIFFGTEMWERYGFYVVQTLLALYLVMYYKWNDHRVYDLVGSFTALTYLSPVIGGWIADKLLGQKIAILLGALVLFLSYLNLGLSNSDFSLMATLAGIAVGTGLLKPNISSLLGNEYPANSSRRESGFTIFYMGITTGIILGTTLPSQIQSYWGWKAAFLSAALGLILAGVVFVFGIFRYTIKDYVDNSVTLIRALIAFLLILAMWYCAFQVLNNPQLANKLFLLVLVLCISYIIYSVYSEPYPQSGKTMIIGFLALISIVFWAFYFQMFLSLTLFIARIIQPTLWGIAFPPPYYVGIQSIGMILLGYLLSRKRLIITEVERSKNIAKKFILSMLCMTLAYFIIFFISNYPENALNLSPFLIIPSYLIISLAELLLSPVGLSAITFLASKEKVSTMMGIFFVSLGLGAFMAGKLAVISAISPEETDALVIKAQYAHAFRDLLLILLAATVVCGLFYWIIIRILNRMEPNLAIKE